MSDRLTLAEIEAQFVSEWVLIEDPQTNNALEVQGGKILYHSKDRDEHAGAVIGGINLRLHFDHHVGEMGYSIARSSWRRGLTTEAARTVMAAAFAAYASLHRIRAMADARNLGSRRVMEKLGMVHEGVLRQNRLVRGECIDEVWCGVLRPEWEAHRQRRNT